MNGLYSRDFFLSCGTGHVSGSKNHLLCRLRDQVGVCHSPARSFTVVGCLFPCDTTARRKQHDTGHGHLLHRKGMHRGCLSRVAQICSNVALIFLFFYFFFYQQDGLADRICYSSWISRSVVPQRRDAHWKTGLLLSSPTHTFINSRSRLEDDANKQCSGHRSRHGRGWSLEAVRQWNRGEYGTFLTKARGRGAPLPALVFSDGYRGGGDGVSGDITQGHVRWLPDSN